MLKNLLAAFTCGIVLLPLTVQADDDYQPGTTHPTVDIGVTVGGDRVATRHYTLFGGTDSVYAGKSLFFDFGVQHNFEDSPWSLKATAGIASGFTVGSGSDISLTRYPLDFLFLYNVERQHLGLGLTYHANPKLDQNGHGPDEAFHDPVGLVLEYQYRFIGFRATAIRYRVDGPCTGKCSYDGSSLGFFLNFVF